MDNKLLLNCTIRVRFKHRGYINVQEAECIIQQNGDV